MAKKNYYAVKRGVTPGIYKTWNECKSQVDGFAGAVYKGFVTREEAENFIASETQIAAVNPLTNNKFEVTAYVDGSFDKDVNRYSYGAVIFHNGKEQHFAESKNVEGLISMRNVAGELMGAMAAMQYCLNHNAETLQLCYDYEGVEKWATGEWKANKPGTQAYSTFYNSIKNRLNVTFVKIAAHTGDKYNDVADALAKQALYVKAY